MPVVAAEDSSAKAFVLIAIIAVVGLVAVIVWALILNDKGRWKKPDDDASDQPNNPSREGQKVNESVPAPGEVKQDKDLEMGHEKLDDGSAKAQREAAADIVPAEGKVASLHNLVLFSMSEGPLKIPSMSRGTQ